MLKPVKIYGYNEHIMKKNPLTYILFVVFIQFILCKFILLLFSTVIPILGNLCHVSCIAVRNLFRDNTFIVLLCLLSCQLPDLDEIKTKIILQTYL